MNDNINNEENKEFEESSSSNENAAEADEIADGAADMSDEEREDDSNDDFADIPPQEREAINNLFNIDLPDTFGGAEEMPPKRPRISKNKKLLKAMLIILGVLFSAFIVLYVSCILLLPSDTVASGVYIEGIDVGGLSYDQTLAKIQRAYMLDNSKITLSANGQSFIIKGSDVELTARPEETAAKAFDYGKSGNKLKDGFTAMKLIVSKHNIIPVAAANEEKLKEKINEFGNKVYGPYEKPYIEIMENAAKVWPGRAGYNGNPDKAYEEVLKAFKNENFSNIHVTFDTEKPVEPTIEEFDAIVYADPIDAHYTVENNQVTIEEAQKGRYINKEEAAALLKNVVAGGNPVDIPFYTSDPSVNADELRSKLFANTMASYSTSYASSTANRASNVARAAALINGKVLAPGEVFSFNDTVGRRTVANGFSTAPEYVNGKTVDGIGGGTCQVSSTLYNAVLYSDLEIVTRTNHMFTVSYVPNGQDATVADGGPDFKFKNNTDHPIKISARTGGGTITVSIIGTNWSPAREVKINNSTSYLNNGDTSVRSTRTVYANGAVLRTEALPSSTYKKHVEEAPAAAEAPAEEEPAQEAQSHSVDLSGFSGRGTDSSSAVASHDTPVSHESPSQDNGSSEPESSDGSPYSMEELFEDD